MSTVLLYSILALLMAGLGGLPFIFRNGVSQVWVRLSHASASGMMLGAGYLLVSESLAMQPLQTLLGAAAGVVFTFATQLYTGLDDSNQDGTPAEGDKVILRNILHFSSEGVAIGVSMATHLRLGIFMALALGVHNIGESLTLASYWSRRGIGGWEATALCLIVKTPQVLLAFVAFSASPFLGDPPSYALGFASGALLFLVLTDLLPRAYQGGKRALVAGAVSCWAGAVVLLKDFFV